MSEVSYASQENRVAVAQKNCLLIVGFGYTAGFLSAIFKNDNTKVIGVSRNPEKFFEDKNRPHQMIHFSEKSLFELDVTPTHVLVSVPPSETGDPTLIECERYLTGVGSTLKSICYLSSTGVYGDHKGEWVDEFSAFNHPSGKAINRLRAERAWQDFSEKNHIPLYIFRVAGIYGPWRNALQKIKNGAESTLFKEGQFFSRIHVEDLANAIKIALLAPEKAGIYNICDNEPTSNADVDGFAAHLLGINPLRHQIFDELAVSSTIREFYMANKKVSNLKMRDSLGIQLSYPDYRKGLTSLFELNQF